MDVTRRQLLVGLAAAGATVGFAGCAPARSSKGGGGGSKSLAVAWWGNPTRNKNTAAAIAAYAAAHKGLTVTGQPGEFSTYWDKLATQVAGGSAPDLIQMDVTYISEYGGRGALLDLGAHGAEVSKFAQGTVDSGKVGGKLYGVNLGINTWAVAVNPKIFAKAGIALPDDTTWTWDDLMNVSAEVAGKTGLYGLTAFFNQEPAFGTFLRQIGKAEFTESDIAFDAGDAQQFFDLMVKFQKAKAMPPAAALTEDAGKSLDQMAFGTNKAALTGGVNSNQVEAVNNASGSAMKLLRAPSMTGKAADRKAWYKASMLWSVSSKTKDPQAAVDLVNWWVNSPECANINLAERGIPANTEILAAITPKLSPAQQGVAKFLADIKPELATPPVNAPKGGGKLANMLLRYETDVLFGRTSTKDAATKFVEELKSGLG
jgi:multiple sugar transport system substrate-binding protein